MPRIIFDIFNSLIYPVGDGEAQDRIDCKIGIPSFTTGPEYLGELHDRLPGFIDSTCNSRVAMAIYNAGTDVLDTDPLGGLSIPAATIRERDLYVVGELRKRGIPTVMVLSGGYTRQSHQLVADSVIPLMEREAEMNGI